MDVKTTLHASWEGSFILQRRLQLPLLKRNKKEISSDLKLLKRILKMIRNLIPMILRFLKFRIKKLKISRFDLRRSSILSIHLCISNAMNIRDLES